MKQLKHTGLCLWMSLTLVSCVGTDTDGNESGAYVSDDGDAQNPVSHEDVDLTPEECDNQGDCWGSCWGCAANSTCSSRQAACSAHVGCAALQSCVLACSDDAWLSCYADCVTASETGSEERLQAFWDCIYCEACVNDCRHVGHQGCETYVPDAPIEEPEPSEDGHLWRQANLTWYRSWPEPGSDECLNYNGCHWAGWFAGLDEQMSPEWVAMTDIIAVHSNHWETYKYKTLRVRQGTNVIDALVLDMCADSDCNGCCTRNMSATGFLIDMEIHTLERMGGQHGLAEWTCLDC